MLIINGTVYKLKKVTTPGCGFFDILQIIGTRLTCSVVGWEIPYLFGTYLNLVVDHKTNPIIIIIRRNNWRTFGGKFSGGTEVAKWQLLFLWQGNSAGKVMFHLNGTSQFGG